MYGHIIRARNANSALIQALPMLRLGGVEVASRGMATVEMEGPVSTVYTNPRERVVFDPVRDANPFFHLMESLWIIGGSNSVALPKYFMSSIDRFSDDGATFHGAYGYRLRHASYDIDQCAAAVSILRKKPDSRQVVMSIWDTFQDLGRDTKDMPCNDLVMLKVRNGELNMTVCNRSNDAIWGAYGANVVQFSMLQEWLAALIGVDVGRYVQQSDSFHVYTDNAYWLAYEAGHRDFDVYDPYVRGQVVPHPLAQGATVEQRRVDANLLTKDCEALCAAAESRGVLFSPAYRSTFFQTVVVPVIWAYNMYKEKNFDGALNELKRVEATDWRMAMTEWVERRQKRAITAAVAEEKA